MPKPYRADHVGSLKRSPQLIEAHQAHDKGDLSDDALRALEDREIEACIRLQKEVDIDILSDGELRRGGWTGDFVYAVDGFERGEPPVQLHWANRPTAGQGAPVAQIIARTLRQRTRFTKTEADFLKAHAGGKQWKITLPAASYLVSRGYKPGVTDKIYKNRAEALAAVATILNGEIKALIDEGVNYVQIDNPHYPDYLMDNVQAQWKALGIDPKQALADDIAADNATVAGLKRGNVAVAMHFCRGNGGSAMWHSEGSYEPIAEQCFGQLDYDRFLLEYDTARAGGFEPLRFVPKGKMAVLGLVSTKVGVLESADLIRQRIDEAARFMPLDAMALSPQCGFSSTLLGNDIDPDQQRRKLAVVVEVARKVWGNA
jgi:5-methyltetrahydropteroyltriglutamate--homocysteine methyltransferase